MACFRVGIALWAMAAACMFSMATAGASEVEERVDVAVFELTGDGVDDELLETFSAIVRQEAQQHSGYALANPAAIRRDEIALIVGCDPDEVECLRQMADYVDGQVLIFGEVEQLETGWSITIDILETEAGEAPIRLERVIEDSRDPVVSFRRNVEEIFSELGAVAKTHLVVEAPDEEMNIYLDGLVVGQGYVERQGLAPGRYRISIGDDDTVWDDEVKLEPGHLVELRPTLESDDSEHPVVAGETSAMEVGDSMPGARSGDTLQGAETSDAGPKALVGVGVAALLGSAVMVFEARNAQSRLVEESNEGDISDERYRELSRLSQRYQNAQYALFGLGAAAIGVGVGWAIFSYDDDGDHEAEVRLAPTSRGVSLFGRW